MSRLLTNAMRAVAALMTATSPLRALQQDSIAAHTTYSAPDGRVVIEPDSLDRAAFMNVAELLQARVPGLSVTRRGDAGTRIYLRGPTSVHASNSPLLIVDGVRIALERSRVEEFDGQPSPLDDIDVEQIERIEVLSGPAAAALYGTGAANGVIRIDTRDARATPTRWRVFAAAGALDEPKPYPANFSRPGSTSGGGVTTACTRRLEAIAYCAPTGALTSFNPLEDEDVVGAASLTRLGGFAASGSDLFAWSGGATFEREGSVIDAVPRQRIHARGAARARLSGGGELALRAHWMDGATPLVTPVFTTVRQQALLDFAPLAPWTGFARYPEPQRDVSRRGVSLSAEWRAAPWLRGSILTGLDHSSASDGYELTTTSGGFSFTNSESRRQRRQDFTGRADVEAEYALGSFLRARTTALVELIEHRRRDRYEGRASSSSGGFSWMTMFRGDDQDISGLALEQELLASDRAALRLGLRHEDVDMLGMGWKTPWYPRASLEWVAARPGPGAVGGVRIHAAYGKAGAVPSLDQVSFILFPWEEPLERKAEVTAEREAGLNVGLLGQRVDVSVSWYSKRTTDVLLQSGGRFGFGEVVNRGVESSLQIRLLDGARANWHVRVGYAHNHNEVTEAAGPTVFASRQWVVEGAPLAGYARFPVTSSVDSDGDGVLETSCFPYDGRVCEVRFGENPAFYPAYSPTEASVENAFRLGRVTVGFLIDHRRGHYLQNETEAFRCGSGRCPEAYETSLSQEGAIRQASVDRGNQLTSGAFLERATFTKLREASIRVAVPASWARNLGGRGLELSLAGRNLATWTDYSGMDPEASSYGDNSLLVGDRAGAPLPRSITLRLTLTQ